MSEEMGMKDEEMIAELRAWKKIDPLSAGPDMASVADHIEAIRRKARKWKRRAKINGKGWRGCQDCLVACVAAVEAARNDALDEAAAILADTCSGTVRSDYADGWDAGMQAAAENVHALKHPRGGSGRAQEADTPLKTRTPSAPLERTPTDADRARHLGNPDARQWPETVWLPYKPERGNGNGLTPDEERLLGAGIIRFGELAGFERRHLYITPDAPPAHQWPLCSVCGKPCIPEPYEPTGVHKAAHAACKAEFAPGHTDLMVPPESIDAFMKANPLPPETGAHKAAHVAGTELFTRRLTADEPLSEVRWNAGPTFEMVPTDRAFGEREPYLDIRGTNLFADWHPQDAGGR